MTDGDDGLRQALAAAYERIDAYYSELGGESPRAAAILAASRLEDEITALLRQQFPAARDSNSLWGKLSGPGRPPSDAASKADALQAFDFYGKDTRKAIELVFRIRNRFAHSVEVRDFGHDSIRSICKELSRCDISELQYRRTMTKDQVRQFYVAIVDSITRHIQAMARHFEAIDGPLQKLP